MGGRGCNPRHQQTSLIVAGLSSHLVELTFLNVFFFVVCLITHNNVDSDIQITEANIDTNFPRATNTDLNEFNFTVIALLI